MLSTGKEGKWRERNDASVKSKLDGKVVRLSMLFPAVPVSGHSDSSRAELTDFSLQPWQDPLVCSIGSAEHSGG